jgi:hypothetical protein
MFRRHVRTGLQCQQYVRHARSRFSGWTGTGILVTPPWNSATCSARLAQPGCWMGASVNSRPRNIMSRRAPSSRHLSIQAFLQPSREQGRGVVVASTQQQHTPGTHRDAGGLCVRQEVGAGATQRLVMQGAAWQCPSRRCSTGSGSGLLIVIHSSMATYRD